MSIQLRQGTDVDRQTVIFEIGELVYTIDTKQVFIGDGTTLGGVDIYNLHNHDGSYFTQAQIVAMLLGYVETTTYDGHVNNTDIHRVINDGGINVTDLWSANKINTELLLKSNTGHIHDDRYYTETEINALLNALEDKFVKISATDTVEGYLDDKIVDGQGITTTIINAGANETLNIGADVFITQVSGLNMPCFIESGKTVSSSMMNFMWVEPTVGNNEWIDIANSNGSTTSHIMPFQGVIVGFTIHVHDQNNKTNDYVLFINGTNIGTIATMSGNGEQSTYGILDVNFLAGDKLQLRSENGSGGSNPNDLVISLFVRWRA